MYQPIKVAQISDDRLESMLLDCSTKRLIFFRSLVAPHGNIRNDTFCKKPLTSKMKGLKNNSEDFTREYPQSSKQSTNHKIIRNSSVRLCYYHWINYNKISKIIKRFALLIPYKVLVAITWMFLHHSEFIVHFVSLSWLRDSLKNKKDPTNDHVLIWEGYNTYLKHRSNHN